MPEPTKNLCAQIPVSLHAKVLEEKEKRGLTLSAYVAEVLTQFYNNDRGDEKTMETMKTLAFQIPASMFDRLKRYLDAESKRTGRKVTQKDFVVGLIQRALDEAEDSAKSGE